MSFTSFSLQNSIQSLKILDKEERRINLQILEILHEIEKYKAYSDLGYDGLFSFCVKELKYTEAQSYQRIQAMRALKANPELKEKIQCGKMNVTTVAQIQTYIRQEQVQAGLKKTAEEKLELFSSFEIRPSREVKDGLSELRGEKIKKKLVIELDEEGELLWAKAKALLAHQSQGDDLNCLKVLMKNILKEQTSRRASSWSTKSSRYIPKQVKIEVRKRDQGKCTQCGGNYALQIEHKEPFANGGERDLQNLELLCRSCNLSRGVKVFGARKMNREI